MTFSYIPHEILVQIAEILASRGIDNKDLLNLVLVSKDFRNATMRLIWKDIRIRNLEKMEFILDLLERECYLGRNARLLDINLVSYKILDAQGRRPSWTISKEDFIKLIKKLPNLRSLSVSNPSFPNFSNDGKDKLVLPLVNYFRYDNGNRERHDPLATLLTIIPNITSLHLNIDPSREAFSLPTTQACLPLDSLTCNRVDLLSLWNTSFLPDTSLASLSCLELDSSSEMNQEEKINIIKTIQLCSSTLKDLTLGDSTFEYELFKDVLPQLKFLKFFQATMEDLPLDILQLIPTNIEYFQVELLKPNLEHFKLHPRPSYNIKCLFLRWWEEGVLEVVPDSVCHITIGYAEVNVPFDDLNEILVDFQNYLAHHVKEIQIPYLDGILVEEDIEKAVDEFKALGIEVEIGNYH